MAIQVQLRRGTATQNNAFTGAIGELSFDTTANQVRVHDGSTAGGFKIGVGDFPTGTNNIALGNTALDSLDATSPGGNNTAVGHDALTANTTASFNTAIGVSSGSLITTGQKNTIVGSFDGNEGGLDIRTANNHIVLSDGDGNPRLIIDNNGNVDIGGETTELKLKNTTHEDTDGGRESKISFQGEQSGGEQSLLAQIQASHQDTSDDQKGELIFRTNDGSDGASPTERMRIDSDGNIGIGTASADCDLHINGATNSEQVIITGGNNASRGLSISTVANGGQSDAGVIFNAQDTENASYPALIYQTGGSERMRIDGNGNVGISTASPSSFSGFTNVTLKTGSSGSNLDFHNSSNTRIAAIVSNPGSELIIETTEATPSIFKTNTVERMRINSTGRIDIGATTNVFSNSSTNGTNFFNNGSHNISSTGTMNFFLNRNGAGEIIRFHNATTGVGSISVGSSSTAYNTSSDYRLKENIVDLTDAITKVKQLQPRRFNWIADDTNTPLDGFIAHEAATVVPQAVEGKKDGLEVWNEGEEIPDGFEVGDNKLDSDGNTIPLMQGIDQSKLVPLLTAALKEAIAKIETLETKVAALEG